MSNIFKHKLSHEEVNLKHIGKMNKTNETVAIYELAKDGTIMVMLLSDFNHDYKQNDFAVHDHFTENEL